MAEQREDHQSTTDKDHDLPEREQGVAGDLAPQQRAGRDGGSEDLDDAALLLRHRALGDLQAEEHRQEAPDEGLLAEPRADLALGDDPPGCDRLGLGAAHRVASRKTWASGSRWRWKSLTRVLLTKDASRSAGSPLTMVR